MGLSKYGLGYKMVIGFGFIPLLIGIVILMNSMGDGVQISIGLGCISFGLCFIIPEVIQSKKEQALEIEKAQLKRMPFHLDTEIVGYVKTKALGLRYGMPSYIVISRYTREDGSYIDFESHPVWLNPESYLGKIVRVYSGNESFNHYLVDTDSLGL